MLLILLFKASWGKHAVLEHTGIRKNQVVNVCFRNIFDCIYHTLAVNFAQRDYDCSVNHY